MKHTPRWSNWRACALAAISLLCVWSVSEAAPTGKWTRVAHQAGVGTVYIDLNSIRTVRPGMQESWMRVLHEDGASVMIRYVFDCKGAQKRVAGYRQFDTVQKPLSANDEALAQSFDAVTPGSPEYKVYQITCQKLGPN